MKHSVTVLLSLTGFAVLSSLAATPAYSQIVENRAGRTIVLPSAPPSQPADLTAGSALRDDCDSILLVPNGASLSGPGSVEILLGTGSGETWWKEVQLVVQGRAADSVRAEGNGGVSPNALKAFPNELPSGQLVLIKPKFLGVPTPVYQVIGLERLANRRVTLLWQRDRC